jgi:hypothetical protein
MVHEPQDAPAVVAVAAVAAVAEEVEGETSSDDDDAQVAESEEAKLMAEMLLREDMAIKSQDDDETVSNASSSSESIPCTETTALSTVSSPGVDAKEQAFESTFTSPSKLVSPKIGPLDVSEGQEVGVSPSPSAQFSASSETIIPIHSQEPSSSLVAKEVTAAEVTAAEVTTEVTAEVTAEVAAEVTTEVAAETTASTAVAAESCSEPPTINITLDSGSSLLGSETEVGSKDEGLVQSELSSETVTDEEEALHVSEFSHKRISVAPQLPPLEGLMIAL